MRLRKVIFITTLVAILAVAQLPAGAKVYNMNYDFPNVVWQDLEKQGFSITDRGTEVGSADMWIKEIEYFDQTAYMLEYIEDSNNYKERTVVKVSGIGFQPLSVTKRIEIGDDVWYYEGNFTGDKIVVSYTTPENQFKQQMSMPLSMKFFSAEVLPYMLRNLKFEEGDIYSFIVFGVEDRHLQSAIVEVTGDEIVEVPSGVYDCWKVEIRMGGFTYEAWYSKKPPQFLIKYYFGKEMGMKNHT
jgi:hypothetical protein